MKNRNFLDFSKKGIAGPLFGAIALAAGIGALILFSVTKEAEFTKQMIETYRQDLYVTLSLIAGIVLSGISFVFDVKFLKYLGFLAYLFAFLNYIVFEIDYLGSLFSSIDPTELTVEFILLTALLALAVLASFLSAVCTKERAGANGGAAA